MRVEPRLVPTVLERVGVLLFVVPTDLVRLPVERVPTLFVRVVRPVLVPTVPLLRVDVRPVVERTVPVVRVVFVELPVRVVTLVVERVLLVPLLTLVAPLLLVLPVLAVTAFAVEVLPVYLVPVVPVLVRDVPIAELEVLPLFFDASEVELPESRVRRTPVLFPVSPFLRLTNPVVLGPSLWVAPRFPLW